MRVSCCRCGGRTRRSSRYEQHICQQELGACGFRWQVTLQRDGEPDVRQYFNRTVTNLSGEEVEATSWRWVATLERNSGGSPPNGRFRLNIYRVLEICRPPGSVPERQIPVWSAK